MMRMMFNGKTVLNSAFAGPYAHSSDPQRLAKAQERYTLSSQ